MEVEPEFFPPLPPKLLSSDPNCLTLDSARTRKIYQELLLRMEEWFKLRGEDDFLKFESELINLKRLLENLDISQLLVLCEFILVIVVRNTELV
jgi:hypothetical protein